MLASVLPLPELAAIRRANMDVLVVVSAAALRCEPADLTPTVRLRIEVETTYQARVNMCRHDQAVVEERREVVELFRACAITKVNDG